MSLPDTDDFCHILFLSLTRQTALEQSESVEVISQRCAVEISTEITSCKEPYNAKNGSLPGNSS